MLLATKESRNSGVRMNENLIFDYLLFGAPQDPQHGYEGMIDIETVKSWQANEYKPNDVPVLVKELDRLMMEYAKKARDKTIKDARLGILLSGGIDSANTLKYLVEVFGSDNIHAYTFGGWGPNTTDVVYSKYTTEAFHIKNHNIVLPKNDYEEETDLYVHSIRKLGIPLDYSNSIPYIYMKQYLLKDEIRYVFNGQNADTLSLAYPAPNYTYKTFKVFQNLFGTASFNFIGESFNPFWFIRRFKSCGTWKYVKMSKDYKTRISNFFKPVDSLRLDLQQKIIVMEEMFTEARYSQNHQKKLMEIDKISAFNQYYDRAIIKFLLKLRPELRAKGNFNKYLLYELAKNNDVPREVREKPKKGLSYGHHHFLENKLHLPIWEKMMSDKNLNQYVDVKRACEKEKDNFFLFDRIRSCYLFMNFAGT